MLQSPLATPTLRAKPCAPHNRNYSEAFRVVCSIKIPCHAKFHVWQRGSKPSPPKGCCLVDLVLGSLGASMPPDATMLLAPSWHPHSLPIVRIRAVAFVYALYLACCRCTETYFVWCRLTPVIRAVSHLLTIRHLITCGFCQIYPNSGQSNVNKNNCGFDQFIFPFRRFGILPRM